ncbi:MAG: carbohydrate ABC transporter permease [Candidatus Scatosoma sp.]
MEKAKKGFFSGRKGKQRIYIIATLSFPAVHFVVFWLWVNLDSILLAFQNNLGEWVGWTNFKWVFNSFLGNNVYLNMWEATKNTLIFFAWNMFVELPVAVVLAYVFFKKIPGNKFFTVCLYLPSIISATVMTTVFKSFVGSDGPLALLYRSLGKTWVYPITQNSTAIPSMLAYNLWTGYGLNIILFHSAMKRIPREIFESAALDGITMRKELTSIILPLIWPILTTMIILAVAGIFGASGPVLLFTNGDYGTMTIGHAMYMQYKVYNQISRAATIGLIYTVIGLPLVFITRWIAGKIGGEYEY